MELVSYLRIVRRRWRMVVACLVLGTAIGAGTSALSSGPKGPGVTYFLAKHTLSGGTSPTNLARDAVFCGEGEVPKRVAAKLGYDNASALATRVICEPHSDTNLLYVAAVDAEGPRAVTIADSFAEQLVLYLREDGEKQKQDTLEVYNRKITSLQNEYWQVQTDLAAAEGAQADLLKQRQQDIGKQINGLKDKRSAADAQPVPTDNLTTLNTAEAVPISQSAFDSLINADPAKLGKASATAAAARTGNVDAAIRAGAGINLLGRAGLGAVFGLILGLGLAIVLDRLDPRIRTKLEAEEAFGWPVIGEIPPLTRRERKDLTLLAFEQPRSRAAEAYRVLRSAVLWVDAADDRDEDLHPIFAPAPLDEMAAAAGEATDQPKHLGRVIMVTSPGPSEGKTTTAANLAAILAETGRSVLVVNCDFRRPRIHVYLGGGEQTRQVVDTKIPNVKLVTHVLDNPNQANPADVVRVQREVIRNARTMFDIVLLDTAPLLTTNDATEVLSVADQVVIVSKAGKTHKEAADRAAELLERRQGPVVGVVLVGATDVPTARYYYYGDVTHDPEPGHDDLAPLDELALVPNRTRTEKTTASPEPAPGTDAFFGPPGSTVTTAGTNSLPTATADASTKAGATSPATTTADPTTGTTGTTNRTGTTNKTDIAAPTSSTDKTNSDATTGPAGPVPDGRRDGGGTRNDKTSGRHERTGPADPAPKGPSGAFGGEDATERSSGTDPAARSLRGR